VATQEFEEGTERRRNDVEREREREIGGEGERERGRESGTFQLEQLETKGRKNGSSSTWKR
jgi:hypothetical protein